MAMMTKEEAKQNGQIGYWNAAPHPVHFPSAKAGGGHHEIAPHTPVLDHHKKLVDWHEDLEIQVDSGLLARILPGSPKYKEVLRLQGQLDKQKTVPTVKANGPTSQTSAPASRFDNGELPEGAVIMPNGGIQYDGKVFGSKTSLEAYLDQQEVASV